MTTITSKQFDISQLPSLKHGMTMEQERQMRIKTCRFIEEASARTSLKFHRVAVSTAMVFFHRFYAKHAFQDHDRFEVAVAAILLAGKTEETPKKLVTVIQECYRVKVRGMQAGRISTQGGTPIPSSSTLDPKSVEFAKLKDRVLLMERLILHTIGFELSIHHPYTFLVEQISKLVNGRKVEYINPPASSGPTLLAKMKNDMTQYAINFTNDSMQTSLCLQFPPQKIAAAMVFLSAMFCKLTPTGGKEWWDIIDHSDFDSLMSVSVQVLDLLLERKSAHKDSFLKIKTEVMALRDNTAVDEPPPAKRPRSDD